MKLNEREQDHQYRQHNDQAHCGNGEDIKSAGVGELTHDVFVVGKIQHENPDNRQKDIIVDLRKIHNF